VSTLRAVQQPLSIPLSFASLNIVTRTATSFTHTLFTLRNDTASITDTLTSVRLLYEVAKIPNRVKVNHLPQEKSGKKISEMRIEHNPDPDDPLLGVPFPEDKQSLELGISVEFRQVSFKYPGSNAYALHNTSFKIERGQLCVIVGINGSGKSTILKLIARLYDPLEGEIRINGQDIRTLRLADLRNATSVLFQDYTLFPLNVCFLPPCKSFTLFFLINRARRFEITSHLAIHSTHLTSLGSKRLPNWGALTFSLNDFPTNIIHTSRGQ
jgi:ABC-type multidrug transport system fused ATPase/permease subunit